MSKAKCDSSLDQLWRNFEDRHYSDLKRISERGSLMMEEVNLAMACVQMLYAELTNRQSQRMIEDLIEKNQH